MYQECKEYPDKPHFPDPPSSQKKKSLSQLRRQERRREEAVSKSDKSIQESSDKDVHPSNDSDKRSETEHTNILSEVTEKSASQAAKFKCDQCSFKGASDKGVKQRTRIKHKIPQPDGQSDCNVDESEYAPTVCPDDSESEDFMEK